jgi:hypothetical protein
LRPRPDFMLLDAIMPGKNPWAVMIETAAAFPAI